MDRPYATCHVVSETTWDVARPATWAVVNTDTWVALSAAMRAQRGDLGSGQSLRNLRRGERHGGCSGERSNLRRSQTLRDLQCGQRRDFFGRDHRADLVSRQSRYLRR